MSSTLTPGSVDTLNSVVGRVAKVQPDKICLVDGPLRMTYREVDAATDCLAAWLQSSGVRNGDIVAIQLPNWCEFLLTFFGVAKAGATASLVPATYRENELRHVLAVTQPKAVVFPKTFKGFDFPSMYNSLRQKHPSVTYLTVDHYAAPGGHVLDRFSPPVPDRSAFTGCLVRPEDPGLIFYTSGTTGEPKAAVHGHRTLLLTSWPMVMALEITEKDVCLVISPLTTPAGISASSIAVLLRGGTVVLEERFDAAEVLRLISSEKVTLLAGTPAHFEMMFAVPDSAAYDLSSIRVVRLTGAFAPAKLVRQIIERIGCRVAVGFGLTEIGTITLTTANDPIEVICTTVGRALPGMEACVFDETTGEMLGPGRTGLVAARAESAFLGYIARDGLDRSIINSDGWLLTGDIGSFDEDGNLHFVGRNKDIINRGGIKISPAEIEELLLDHPRVEAVAIVAMPDQRLGERACAYVVPRSGATVSLEELIGFLKGRGVATFKLPERLELTSELPLTRNLKVQKEALRRDIAQKLQAERLAQGR